MMSSTFPNSLSNHNNVRNRLKEIQSKKETLTSLEIALKTRVNEFKELCLKEGEITGHLPIDYPLQPREPIPQIRRRIIHKNNNNNNNHSNNINNISNNTNIQNNNNNNNLNDLTRMNQFPNHPIDVSTLKPLQHFNINELANFQPYYEETKPFQMSDFYKYSSKHRQKVISNPIPPPTRPFRTTRQLQEDVSKKNLNKLSSSCDEQFQASVRLIERSGQKLLEATTKAIAGNPGLAEKLNNILPNNGDRYHH